MLCPILRAGLRGNMYENYSKQFLFLGIYNLQKKTMKCILWIPFYRWENWGISGSWHRLVNLNRRLQSHHLNPHQLDPSCRSIPQSITVDLVTGTFYSNQLLRQLSRLYWSPGNPGHMNFTLKWQTSADIPNGEERTINRFAICCTILLWSWFAC